MYVLIHIFSDGTSHELSNDLQALKTKFLDLKLSIYEEDCDDPQSIYIAKVELNEPFGFGAYGDFFGGDIIEDFYSEFERE